MKGQVLKPRPNRGYGFVALRRDGVRCNQAVHRLVAFAFLAPPTPDQTEVCHNDGDPSNNAVTNLRWGTHSENMLDKIEHGTDRFAVRTHCIHGHEYTLENLVIAPSIKGRACRTCREAIEARRDPGRKR